MRDNRKVDTSPEMLQAVTEALTARWPFVAWICWSAAKGEQVGDVAMEEGTLFIGYSLHLKGSKPLTISRAFMQPAAEVLDGLTVADLVSSYGHMLATQAGLDAQAILSHKGGLVNLNMPGLEIAHE